MLYADEVEMNRRAQTALVILALMVLLALTSGYDFWRGYRETHSFEGGIFYTFMGFVILGIVAGVQLFRTK